MMRGTFSVVSILFIFASPVQAGGLNGLNPFAAQTVLYEMQVQSANACRTDTGADWQKAQCSAKIAPPYSTFNYIAKNGDKNSCGDIQDKEKVKLGTFEDMLEDTNDFRNGITLNYIRNRIGPVMIWLQPPFPHNDRYYTPYNCDNTGSPYAVRDYMHAQGTLSRTCIAKGLNENSVEDGKDENCWGTDSLKQVIDQAHQKGLKIMLDMAFNHFGHKYQFYDYENFTPTRDRIGLNQNLDDMWQFDGQFQNNLLNPNIIDTEAALTAAANRTQNGQLTPNAKAIQNTLSSLNAYCAKQNVTLKGDRLVRAFGMWREMLDVERGQFQCNSNLDLEDGAKGFFLGGFDFSSPRPASILKGDYYHGDNSMAQQLFKGFFFDQDWIDVKFLFLHDYQQKDGNWEYQTYIRNREYLFRVLNYWVSLGVDGFRLDHTTDKRSGISGNFWKYVMTKTTTYAQKRWAAQGKNSWDFKAPIYLAEEFDNQPAMTGVADVMTQGYVGDMRNGITRDTYHVEDVLNRASQYKNQTYIMRGLEDHDETRLRGSFNGDPWIGAGFWAIGAAAPGTPMIHAGQEFGEPNQLGFKQSTILRSRFEGTGEYYYGDSNSKSTNEDLVNFYGRLVKARLDPVNSAFFSWNSTFLREKFTSGGAVDTRIFAQARYADGGSSVLFTFNNLWDGMIDQHFFIWPQDGGKMSISDGTSYRLVNALTGQQMRDCLSGADLKTDFGVAFPYRDKFNFSKILPVADAGDWRVQWLRLEVCPQ